MSVCTPREIRLPGLLRATLPRGADHARLADFADWRERNRVAERVERIAVSSPRRQAR
jgi:hypothetical protein